MEWVQRDNEIDSTLSGMRGSDTTHHLLTDAGTAESMESVRRYFRTRGTPPTLVRQDGGGRKDFLYDTPQAHGSTITRSAGVTAGSAGRAERRAGGRQHPRTRIPSLDHHR